MFHRSRDRHPGTSSPAFNIHWARTECENQLSYWPGPQLYGCCGHHEGQARGKALQLAFLYLVRESGASRIESWTGTILSQECTAKRLALCFTQWQGGRCQLMRRCRNTRKRRKDVRGVWDWLPRLPKRGHLKWVFGIGTHHDGNRSGETRVHHTLAQSQKNDFRIICFFWGMCVCVRVVMRVLVDVRAYVWVCLGWRFTTIEKAQLKKKRKKRKLWLWFMIILGPGL